MGMSGQGGGSRGSRTVLSEINVTPLVDVMLVLLIIFMVTAPLMQQGIEVDLPETEGTGVQATEEPMILSISADQKIKVASQNVSIGDLKEKLKSIFETRKNKEIYIQADRHVDYGFVAEVMAEIRGAGIFQLGLLTLPKTD